MSWPIMNIPLKFGIGANSSTFELPRFATPLYQMGFFQNGVCREPWPIFVSLIPFFFFNFQVFFYFSSFFFSFLSFLFISFFLLCIAYCVDFVWFSKENKWNRCAIMTWIDFYFDDLEAQPISLSAERIGVVDRPLLLSFVGFGAQCSGGGIIWRFFSTKRYPICINKLLFFHQREYVQCTC